MVRADISSMSSVLVTGGAGYVGAALVPKLLARGHRVTVLDRYWYGREALAAVRGAAHLREIDGDIRDGDTVKRALDGCDAVIHLACISNDPSFELDPDLGRSINYEAFAPLVAAAKTAGVARFIYASSSSVYGVSESLTVDEDHPLLPLTDYSKYKMLCEPVLLAEQSACFTTFVLRPATVCGYSSRMRFDLSVNILTKDAVTRGKITVFGGAQTRPNIHIDDLTDLYADLLDERPERIAGQILNAGFQNRTIADLAALVRDVVSCELPHLPPIAIETTPSADLRSYRVDSERIADRLGFRPRRTIEDAVRDICRAFAAGRFGWPVDDRRYYNVAVMKDAGRRAAAVTA
jgi:nucleoside-diphosphate-sugar epimerase